MTFISVIPEAVIAVGVALVFVIPQVKVTLQLLAPEAISQEEDAGVRVPVIGLFSEQLALPPPLVP